MIFKQALRKQVTRGIIATGILVSTFLCIDYLALPKSYLLLIIGVFVLGILHLIRSRRMFNVEVTDTHLKLRTGDRKSDVTSVLLTAIESVYLRAVPTTPTEVHIKEAVVYLEISCDDGAILELPHTTHGKHFHSMINMIVKGNETVLYDTIAKQPRDGFNRVLTEIMQGKMHPQPFLEHTYIGSNSEDTPK